MSLARTDRGSGPPVVLIHGFPLDRTLWDPLVESLASSHRVLAPDLPGFGDSPPRGETYTVDRLADDVLTLLDESGVRDTFSLGGHSMGGYVALAIAARFPERVSRLILVASRAAADSPEAATSRLRLAEAAEQEGSIAPVVETFLPRLLGPTSQRDAPVLVAHVRSVMNRAALPAVAGCLRGLAARPDRTALLATLTLPALVLAGEEDPIAPPDEGSRIVAALPRGQLRVIPRSGHLPMIENPEATTRALAGFLAG